MADLEVCPHCGGPMERNVAFLNFGGDKGCDQMPLPPHCPSKECREARDEAALARMIERGIIDP